MKMLSLIVRELVGMFVDDEFLAIAVLAVVAFAALLILVGMPPLVAGVLLLLGSIAVMVISVIRTSRKN